VTDCEKLQPTAGR